MWRRVCLASSSPAWSTWRHSGGGRSRARRWVAAAWLAVALLRPSLPSRGWRELHLRPRPAAHHQRRAHRRRSARGAGISGVHRAGRARDSGFVGPAPGLAGHGGEGGRAGAGGGARHRRAGGERRRRRRGDAAGGSRAGSVAQGRTSPSGAPAASASCSAAGCAACASRMGIAWRSIPIGRRASICSRPPIRWRWPGRAASSWPIPSTTTTGSATWSWCGAWAKIRKRARSWCRARARAPTRASSSGTWASWICRRARASPTTSRPATTTPSRGRTWGARARSI